MFEESELKPFTPTYEVFDHDPAKWEAMKGEVGTLLGEVAPELFVEGRELTTPILNDVMDPEDTRSPVAYDDARDAFLSNDSTIVLVRDNGEKLAGLSLAMPVSRMYPDRASEDNEAAYIYLTGRSEAFRGHRLANGMNLQMFEELYRKGIKFAERDAMVENGYSKRLLDELGDSVIGEPIPHEKYGWPQLNIRVDIQKYLQNKQKGA